MSINIYQENIIDHYNNPRHFELLKDYTYKGEFSNLSCGDEVTITLKTDKEDIVTDIGFSGSGCALSIATMSILTDYLIGKTIKEINNLNYSDILDLIKITPSASRSKCVLTGLEAIREAIKK